MVSDKNFYFGFEIEKTLPNGLGRAGVIHTPHGDIKTPAFMVVGTMGEVKNVSPKDLHQIKAQAMLSNGYHLRKKSHKIAESGGLASYSGWNGPTLTDSGGFQVMSLGSGLGKVVSMERAQLEGGVKADGTTQIKATNTAHKDRLAKVSDKGVDFIDPFTGEPDFIGPEESMQIQCRIGADIHMAFDELTSLADTYEYNVEALKRTEKWAKRSLNEHLKHRDDLGYRQSLYGVLQGGRWEDLRRKTAKKLGKMEFDGFGLGGAFLKEDLGDILRWCNEELPDNKPRHLLGLSHPDDIFIGAEMGADTFDCVAPTREARHGKLYSAHGEYNLRKYNQSTLPLDEKCDCPTCKAGYTRGDLRALWKSGDQTKKKEFYNLASMHNVRFIIRLTENIRKSIIGGYFEEYKNDFLKNYYG
ncbi:tRNA guanosine(34) transglycosylase Tgt [Candidatus Saccharibacteria bacterium]|nr:tRNA guanosine(34) transglycosylase Tgt [Candidatus Saccharibacteria bacterium]